MLTPALIRGARAMLQMSQAELAASAGISKTGLANLETGQADSRGSTLAAIRRALETAGVEFVDESGGRPGVRIREKSMRKFNRAEAASITVVGKSHLSGNDIVTPQSRLDFFTFEEAVRHFMTILPEDQREFACIDTASGEHWLFADIREIIDPARTAPGIAT
jgi:transcriptional regulator with XRE-family HTH domain